VRHGACEALDISAFIGGKIIFAANGTGGARKPDEPTLVSRRLHTDESRLYPVVGAAFAKHETVNHSPRELDQALALDRRRAEIKTFAKRTRSACA